MQKNNQITLKKVSAIYLVIVDIHTYLEDATTQNLIYPIKIQLNSFTPSERALVK